jgi:glyoxylase-like metal-dependent hydrolase (beta-lactamase superfamily II)
MEDGNGLFGFVKGAVKLIRGHGYPFCHALLVEGERTAAIVDPACGEEKIRALREVRRVDYLLASHAHEDHLGGNYLFPDAQFLAHPDEAPALEAIEGWLATYFTYAGTEEAKEFWRRFLLEGCHYVPRRVDRHLADGDVLDLGGVTLEVVHTPGHTSGHCAFYVPEEKVMFTADLDLMKDGPYYGDPSSDIDATLRSLARIASYDVETYLTGHGRGIYAAESDAIDRYRATIAAREEKLLSLLAGGPRTLEEVAQARLIYGQRSIPGDVWDLIISERSMMAKHLDRLVQRGTVCQEGELFVLSGNSGGFDPDLRQSS